jgi:hypothetical protein
MKLVSLPRRLGRTWWRRWAVRLAVVLAIAACCFLYLLQQNNARLREAEARLDRDDPGWRIDDIESAREQIPAAENSALVVVAVGALLPEGWPPQEVGNACANLVANERLRDEDYARLCNELNEWDAATAEARRLTDMPRGRHKILLSRPNLIMTALGNQQKCRAAAQLLFYQSLRRAEEGDADGTLADCRATINAGRSIGDEPFLISVLIRNACVSIGCNSIARVLGQGQPSTAALLAMQQLLEDEDGHDGYRLALRGERASLHEMLGAIESGQLKFSQVAGTGRVPAERLLSAILHPAVKNEHVNILGLMTRYVDSAHQAPREQIATEAAMEAEFKVMPKTAILARNLVPAIGKVGDSVRRKHAWVRSLIACLAAERYRQAHGAWPSTLADLVPAELAAVPVDPYDGQPLRMRRLADGIVIYSIGSDQTDDGGKLAPSGQVNKPGFDPGFRLWDPEHRAVPAATQATKGP